MAEFYGKADEQEHHAQRIAALLAAATTAGADPPVDHPMDSMGMF